MASGFQFFNLPRTFRILEATHCWPLLSSKGKDKFSSVKFGFHLGSSQLQLAELGTLTQHHSKSWTALCAPCHSAGENSLWAEAIFGAGRNTNPTAQCRTAATFIFKVPHCALKSISVQNSRKIQCPEMKYRLSCKCFPSASHHSNKTSELFKSHWGIYIIYTKGCPQQLWEFPAKPETRQKTKENRILWKKAQGDKISRNVWAQAMGARSYGHMMWWGSWCWAMAWTCFEPLLLSTNHTEVRCASMYPMAKRFLQTPPACWAANPGPPGPPGLCDSAL